MSVLHYTTICYTLLKRDTRAVVISDTVRFWHPTMAIPTVTPEDCLIHCLRALTQAVQGGSDKDADDQLAAIDNMRALFQKMLPAATEPTTLAPTAPTPMPCVQQLVQRAHTPTISHARRATTMVLFIAQDFMPGNEFGIGNRTKSFNRKLTATKMMTTKDVLPMRSKALVFDARLLHQSLAHLGELQ